MTVSVSKISSSATSHKASRSFLPKLTTRACLTACAVVVLSQPSIASPLPGAIFSPSVFDTRDNVVAITSRVIDDSKDINILPAQIGGIVGSYAISLVLVASILLLLSKRRRERLAALDEPEVYETPAWAKYYQVNFTKSHPPLPEVYPLHPGNLPRSPVILSLRTQGLGIHTPGTSASPQNSWASYTPQTQIAGNYVQPTSISPVSSKIALGVDLSVDQTVVEADRIMASRQLEEMYSHVMAYDEAKRLGQPLPNISMPPVQPRPSDATSISSKKSRAKPGTLDLADATMTAEKQSKTSLFKQLLSPRSKKPSKGLSISSPIMTPQSATFSKDMQELSYIPPRSYAPASPPPIPTDQQSFRQNQNQNKVAGLNPLTPDFSPISQQSIDERLDNIDKAVTPVEGPSPVEPAPTSNKTYVPKPLPLRTSTEAEPVSTTSQTPLVGLPASPRFTTGSFPGLPASPRTNKFPGSNNSSGLSLPLSPRAGSFSRPNPPSAVRTGGVLPLRAYEPSMASPRTIERTTKQTTFERTVPFTPMTARTPGTSVPYSPYQPFSPVVPVTPSLVTKKDRKRMMKMMPKTPTTEMVQSQDDMW